MEKTIKKFGAFQYIKNISSNVIVFIIHTVISYWYTPYLVHSLGKALYGFIPLATSVSSYFMLITTSVNRSTGRYLTIALEEDDEKANQVFSTSFFVTFAIILAVIPIGIGLVIFTPNIFNVPINSEKEVQYIFIGAIIALFLATLRGNFSVISFSQNRFDIKNVINLLARLGQIALVLALFSIYQPSLLVAGLGIIIVPIIGMSGEIVYWKRVLPKLKLKFGYLKLALLKKMMNTSFWMLLITVGTLMIISMEMVVANKTLDLEIAGMYGALFTFPNNLRFLSNAIGGVWGPTILSKSRNKNIEEIDYYVKLALKLTGLAIALPVGYIGGFANQLLVIWLGPEYGIMGWVLIFMVLHLSTNLLITPLYSVLVARNKLKIPALVSLVLGVIAVLLMFNWSGKFGAIGIAAAAALMMTLNNSIFFPIYTAKSLGYPWWHYITRIFQVILITLFTAGISHLVGTYIEVDSLGLIFATGIPISIIYGLAIYFWGLNKKERSYIGLIFQMKSLKSENTHD